MSRRGGIVVKIDPSSPARGEETSESSSSMYAGGAFEKCPDEEDLEGFSFQDMSPYGPNHHTNSSKSLHINHLENVECLGKFVQDDLTRSRQSHRFQCTLCGEVFREAMELEVHNEVHSVLQHGKKYVCEFCEKRFKRSQELQVHRRIHTGEKPYQCPICKKSFSQSSSVQLHLPVHTGEKPFLCPVCQKPFSRLSHMKKHCKNIHEQMSGHTGDK